MEYATAGYYWVTLRNMSPRRTYFLAKITGEAPFLKMLLLYKMDDEGEIISGVPKQPNNPNNYTIISKLPFPDDKEN